MKLYVAALALLISLADHAAVLASDVINERIAILKSKDAEGSVDRLRLAAIVKLSCKELHVSEAAVPRVVIFHASRESATIEGIGTQEPMMAERKGETAPPVYHVWVIDKPTDEKLVTGIVTVLRRHLKLDLSPDKVIEIESRICLELRATIDIKSLNKGKKT